jgi:hypothetical protein
MFSAIRSRPSEYGGTHIAIKQSGLSVLCHLHGFESLRCRTCKTSVRRNSQLAWLSRPAVVSTRFSACETKPHGGRHHTESLSREAIEAENRSPIRAIDGWSANGLFDPHRLLACPCQSHLIVLSSIVPTSPISPTWPSKLRAIHSYLDSQHFHRCRHTRRSKATSSRTYFPKR